MPNICEENERLSLSFSILNLSSSLLISRWIYDVMYICMTRWLGYICICTAFWFDLLARRCSAFWRLLCIVHLTDISAVHVSISLQMVGWKDIQGCGNQHTLPLVFCTRNIKAPAFHLLHIIFWCCDYTITSINTSTMSDNPFPPSPSSDEKNTWNQCLSADDVRVYHPHGKHTFHTAVWSTALTFCRCRLEGRMD